MKRNGELIPEDSQVFKESVKEARVFNDDIISSAAVQESLKSLLVSFPSFSDLVQTGGTPACQAVSRIGGLYEGCTYMDSYFKSPSQEAAAPARENQG